MKKALLSLALAASSLPLLAQCPSTPPVPGVLTANYYPYVLHPGDSSYTISFTTQPQGLPNTEFFISSVFDPADDGQGPAIVGASIDGRFYPSDYGLGICDEFIVTPFSYDLHQLRRVIHSFLNDSIPFAGSCCSVSAGFFPGICDSLNAAGIYDSTDVTSISDFVVLVGTLSGGRPSIAGMTQSIDFLNQMASNFSACTGGVTEICYAVETLGYDYYQIQDTGNVFTAIVIDQDSQAITTQGGTAQYTVQTTPSSSNDDHVIWWVDGSCASVDSNGLVTAQMDGTCWVIAQAAGGCVRDTATIYVNTQTALAQTELFEGSARLRRQGQAQVLDLNLRESQGLIVEVLDMQGRLLSSRSVEAQVGTWLELGLEPTQLPAGLYLMRVQGPKIQKTWRLARW